WRGVSSLDHHSSGPIRRGSRGTTYGRSGVRVRGDCRIDGWQLRGKCPAGSRKSNGEGRDCKRPEFCDDVDDKSGERRAGGRSTRGIMDPCPREETCWWRIPKLCCRQWRKALAFLRFHRIRVTAQAEVTTAHGRRRQTLDSARDKGSSATAYRSRRYWCLIQPATLRLPPI